MWRAPGWARPEHRVRTVTAATRLRRTIRNPYRVPRPAAVGFSGGRTGPDGRACKPMKRFRLGETYAELKAAALAHRDLFDDAESDPDRNAASDSFDCHCTD